MYNVDKVVLWGATGQCAVVAEILEESSIPIVAIFDHNDRVSTSYIGTVVSHGKRQFALWIERLKKTNEDLSRIGCVVTVGGVMRGADRLSLTEFMAGYGLNPVSIIHPNAVVSRSAQLESSCQILANAFVGSGARIGRCCILNTGSSLDHNSLLGDGVHLGPQAVVAGEVSVGRNTFVGANATILPGMRVGRDCIIGAGSVVTRDVPDESTIMGVPGRVV